MSKIRLGDIADIQAGPFGTQLHKDEYVDKGIPMLNSKNIGNGSIVTSSLDYVSPSICSRLPNYVLKTGDILFGRAGTIERHAYLPAQYNGCFQGTNCIRIRCYDEKKALFISYFLWTKQVKQTIENSAGGSIQSYITTDLLKSLFVEIPDNYEEIADLLIALDNKIENNYKINDNLQQVIKSCFDFMFATRKPNGIISDILQEHPKSTIQVNDSTGILGDYPFFTSGEAINEWQSALVDGMNCYLSTGGNATIKGYYGKAAYSTDTWCVCGKGEYSFYLFCYLKSIIRSINDSFFAGSGLKHLQKDSLLLVNLYIPSEKELEKFNLIVKPAMEMMTKLFLETKKLKQQRDFLLPLLMNGQATIAE